MSECESQLLSAYVDDELSPQDRHRILEHVRQCPTCARELQTLQTMTSSIRQYPFADLTANELENLHEAIEASKDQPILRIGWMLSAAAASILIVGSAWLMEIPAAAPSPTVAVLPTESWEQMAMTLKPSFVLDAGDTGNSDVQMARADLANWMLESLK